MNFYQACYGKPDKISWSLFNCSDNITTQAKEAFIRTANNKVPQYFAESETTDSLYEYNFQKDRVIISKTKYRGFVDAEGRATMFTHGFIFEDDDIDRRALSFLNFSDCNFHFTLEETSNIPSKYQTDYEPCLENFCSAAKACSIDESENLLKFVKCIYYSLYNACNEPLYIISSRSNEIMRPMIYCALSVIPRAFWNKYSFSNGNNLCSSFEKAIMFVEKDCDGKYYNADTFETNIEINSSSLARYPAVAKLANDGQEAFFRYINDIDAIIFNKLRHNDIDFKYINIANIILSIPSDKSQLSDKEIIKKLNYLVNTKVNCNFINEYIVSFINLLIERRCAPSIEFASTIKKASEKTNSQEYKDAAEMFSFISKTIGGYDKMAAFLTECGNEKEKFKFWSGKIISFYGEEGEKNIYRYIKEDIIPNIQDVSKLNEIYISYKDELQNEKINLFNSLNERALDIAAKRFISAYNEKKFDIESLISYREFLNSCCADDEYITLLIKKLLISCDILELINILISQYNSLSSFEAYCKELEFLLDRKLDIKQAQEKLFIINKTIELLHLLNGLNNQTADDSIMDSVVCILSNIDIRTSESNSLEKKSECAQKLIETIIKAFKESMCFNELVKNNLKNWIKIAQYRKNFCITQAPISKEELCWLEKNDIKAFIDIDFYKNEIDKISSFKELDALENSILPFYTANKDLLNFKQNEFLESRLEEIGKRKDYVLKKGSTEEIKNYSASEEKEEPRNREYIWCESSINSNNSKAEYKADDSSNNSKIDNPISIFQKVKRLLKSFLKEK